MKKLIASIATLLIAQTTFSQSQRLVLYEEFTGENCAPCAATNPGLNTLLAANTSKIRAIKYQCAIPSAPPAGSLYSQTAAEMDVRRLYYSVPFAPYGRHDGLVVSGTYPGHPQYFNQTTINNQYAVPSSFDMSVSHSYTAGYDSINVQCIVTCSQAFTSNGTFKLHVVMIEEEIHLPAAIGTNGEKDFEDVMRKMIPNANGTTLTGSWTLSQADTFDFKVKIPSYIYDYNEIAFVAFLQEDGNKEVEQSAYSAPILLAYDAAVSNSLTTHACDTTISPEVTLKNNGTDTLTSVDFSYTVNGGTASTYNWTGTLAPGASTQVILPAIFVPSAGITHTLSVSTLSSVNGGSGSDYNTPNNSNKTKVFYRSTPTIVNETFEPISAPLPTGWLVDNVDGDEYLWHKRNNGSMSYLTPRNYFVPAGYIDHLFAPMMDLSSLSGSQYLHFDVGYCQKFGTENDKLDVSVSTNCGSTWTNVFSKQGATLATAPLNTANWFPTSQASYRTENVDITSYIGQENVLFRFTVTSGGGNNVYIDNVNINSTPDVGVKTNDVLSNTFVVYPNPFSDNTTLTFELAQSEKVFITIQNLIGETVYTNDLGVKNQGQHQITLSSADIAAGMYIITINTNSSSVSKKITVNK